MLSNMHGLMQSRLLVQRTVLNSSRAVFSRSWNRPKYSCVLPGKVSPQIKSFPDTLELPPYALSGEPPVSPLDIPIQPPELIERMRETCSVARKVLDAAADQVTIGVTTDYIDEVVHETCLSLNAYPSPLNYRGFPKSVCTSVNNVAVHGIPDNRPLEDGDIINIDITVYKNGVHGDCSETYTVGDVDKAGLKLLAATKECLEAGIRECGPDRPFTAIGEAIHMRANWRGFTILPSITGHGIGDFFHGPPEIYHCRNSYPGQMQPGMIFTIEPALSEGGEDVFILQDGWTVVTEKDTRAAQFEHTVLITDSGYEVLTKKASDA